MAFGTRSVMSHRVVDVVMGHLTIQYETIAIEATVVPTSTTNTSDARDIHSMVFQDVSVSLSLSLSPLIIITLFAFYVFI